MIPGITAGWCAIQTVGVVIIIIIIIAKGHFFYRLVEVTTRTANSTCLN